MPDHVASLFVSHAHVDESYVREFCARLDVGGCWMWIDEDQLRVGDSLPERISEAIEHVDFCVALLSANAVGSQWCQRELSLALSTEIVRGNVFVLPVRIDDTPVPPLLRDRRYLDARGMTARQAADQVLISVREHLRPTRVIPPRRLRPPDRSLSRAPGGAVRPQRRRASVLLAAVLASLSI